jgi:hypothetical protein
MLDSQPQDYEKAYEAYLKAVYDKEPDNKINQLKEELIRIDTNLKGKGLDVDRNLNIAAEQIQNKTLQIYEKAKLLDLQKDKIDRKNEELQSKKRQIEMGVQKNKYRRNIIILLIILNIVILSLFYYFYKKTSA